jgi:hypothetical protein
MIGVVEPLARRGRASSVRSTGVVAAGVPVAAFVMVDPSGWFPFGPVKWAAVSVVAAVAVALIVWPGVWLVPRRAGVVWLAMLSVLAVSTVFALDPRLAWFGTAERNLGVVAWVLFAGAFVVGATVAATASPSHAAPEIDVGDDHAPEPPGARPAGAAEVGPGVRTVVRGVVVATAFAGGYALVEWWFGPPIGVGAVTDRLGGPFGSAAYLAAAMCLGLPICAGLALDATEHRVWRWSAGIGTALAAVALLGSGTRGAWLGLGVAVAVLAPRLVRRSSGRSLRRVVGAAAMVGVAALVVVAPRLDDVVQRSTPAASRLAEWRIALDVIAQRPWIGAGPEGYRLVVGGSIDDDYERTYGRVVAPDRAHNGVLDVAAVGGVGAAALYLALLAMVLAAGWRVSARGAAPLVGVAVGLAAYVAQQVFLFPIATLDVVAWLLAGILVVGSGTAVWTVRLGRPGRLAARSAAAVAVTVLAVTGVLGVAADRSARRAITSTDRPSAVAVAQRSIELRPDAVRTRLLLADLHAGASTVRGWRDAVTAVEAAVVWSPRDPIVRRQLAAYRSGLAEVTGDPVDVATALDTWRQVVADDPSCAACQLGLGAAAALADDVALARSAWQRAADLTDDPLPDALLAELDRIG